MFIMYIVEWHCTLLQWHCYFTVNLGDMKIGLFNAASWEWVRSWGMDCDKYRLDYVQLASMRDMWHSVQQLTAPPFRVTMTLLFAFRVHIYWI